MKVENLGQIKKVEIREVFKDEARDFTPWLAKEENLAVLSEEIGVDIKLLEVEASVGRFSVDILAEEEGTGKKIVIENQFNYTDHDHLGKLITYASGHDAKVIIWIFEDIRDEHRQAIEWLNENTNENIDFFAINIQLWRIDNSNPAPKFEIIVSPNEWTKAIRSRSSKELTDLKIQQLDFWNRFYNYSAQNFKNLKLRKPRPQHWYDLSLGSSEAHISLTVQTQKNEIGCSIYITDNKEMFFDLRSKSDELEKILKVKLEWIEASKACRIKTIKENMSIHDQEKEIEIFNWFGKVALSFQQVFSDLIKDYVRNR